MVTKKAKKEKFIFVCLDGLSIISDFPKCKKDGRIKQCNCKEEGCNEMPTGGAGSLGKCYIFVQFYKMCIFVYFGFF
jgi:hypothetical protein